MPLPENDSSVGHSFGLEFDGIQIKAITEVTGLKMEQDVIELKQNTLAISGKKSERSENTGEVLHQGIASRAFERRFQLADFVEVRGADLENGLLHVTLKREIPEAMKPRTIPINGKNGTKTIESKRAA